MALFQRDKIAFSTGRNGKKLFIANLEYRVFRAMMKKIGMSLVALTLFSAPLKAQDFGLSDSALAGQFYDEALEIVKENMTPEQKLFYGIQNSGNAQESKKDGGFGVLREAYRADPEATLELIRRIMEAGGAK